MARYKVPFAAKGDVWVDAPSPVLAAAFAESTVVSALESDLEIDIGEVGAGYAVEYML